MALTVPLGTGRPIVGTNSPAGRLVAGGARPTAVGWSPGVPRGSLSGGESTLFVTPNASGLLPNEGIEMNLTGFTSRSLDARSSFQVAIEETIGSFEAVVGVFENGSFGPAGFFEVFATAGDREIALDYGTPSVLVPGSAYCFRLSATSATNWSVTVNGAPFASPAEGGTFDFGTNEATSAGGLAFSEVALYSDVPSEVVPVALNATTAIAAEVNGTWTIPTGATTSFEGSASGRWGVAGRSSDPDLAPDEVGTGSSFAPTPNGSVVWSGGAIPVTVSVTVGSPPTGPAPGVLGMETLPVDALVRTANGTPLPGVPLLLSDRLGGAPTPGGAVSGPDGNVTLDLVTPNVSAAGNDTLTVTSTLLGFPGSGSAIVEIAPAIEVLLDVAPAHPSVDVDGTLALTVTSRGLDGTIVGGTVVAFESIGGGALSSPSGRTDAVGTVSVAYTAGAAVGSVTVRAIVEEPGAWGRASVNITVVPAPPPIVGSTSTGWVLAGAIVAAAIVGGLLLRRRPKLPLPASPVRTAGTASVTADVSRTPPSAGTP